MYGLSNGQFTCASHVILQTDRLSAQDHVRRESVPVRSGENQYIFKPHARIEGSTWWTQYAFASQIALRDFSPDSLLRVNPRDGEYVIRTEDILRIIEEEGDSIAVICFGAVQYYSAEFFDMEAITRAGHAKVSSS